MTLKLKWKQRRTLLVFVAIVLGMSTVLICLNNPMPNTSEKSALLPYMPIMGEEVSLTQAQASVPFKINTPTNRGTFTQLRLDGEVVMIVYADSKPSSGDSIHDVISQNGVILLESPNKMTLQNASQNIRDAISATKNDVGGGLQPVTINGYLGFAGGNVWHTVRWYTETTEYELIANINYPLQQLTETAKSIPIN